MHTLYSIKMTHKDFLQDLQKACHIDNQQCTMLLNALCRLMAQAGVEQIPVTLSGLGTFTSHKHPEYIQEDPQTGRQTLFPPRISYRMHPDTSDGQQQIVERQLAEHTRCDISLVHAFLDGVVRIILDSLAHGEEVEVKGLGVFRNIITHQGELQRVAYTPDDQMRRLVNAPFDCFEPIVIAEPAHAANVVEIEEGEECVNEGTVVDEEHADEELVVNVEHSDVEHSDEEPILEVPIAADTNADLADDSLVSDPVADNSAPDSPVESVSTEVSESSPEVSHSSLSNDNPAATKSSSIVIHDSGEQHRSFFTIWHLLFLLCVIVLAAVIWFVHTVRVESNSSIPVPPELNVEFNHPAESVESSSDTLDTLAQFVPDTLMLAEADTLAVVKSDVTVLNQAEVQTKPVPQTQTEPKVEDKSSTSIADHCMKNADGSVKTYKLQPGERLTLVALQYYGDKAFWPYIYEVNRDKIKTPNIVPAGIDLRLPDPAYFGIDVNDPQSLHKAKLKASALSKQ